MKLSPALVAAMPLLMHSTLAGSLHADDWKPAKAPLMTRWAAEVDPANPLPEYPRPQMERKAWVNLNGLWDYAITNAEAEAMPEAQGRILVPFAIESALSGVGKAVGPDKALWYRRTFDRPKLSDGGRLLLHFGAVDWHAHVFVNGKSVGEHKGGFDPFTFDVTEALTGDGAQTLTVRVWDPTDTGAQPRGKQVLNPHGIFYTAVTGIWQTVWLEPVPKVHVRSLKIDTVVGEGEGWVNVVVRHEAQGKTGVTVEVFDGDERINFVEASVEGERSLIDTQPIAVKVPSPKLWSPDTPFLYRVRVTLEQAGESDIVESYAGIRRIEMKKDETGTNRLFLNGKPLFQYGPLDQGWWPDGLYTAPTDEALKFDIEITRKMGFNMARKHVKVEPARWYYWADKLGLLVWQDMPTLMQRGKRHQVQGGEPADIELAADASAQFRAEWRAIMDALHNSPCIVVWVPFNEGWGQYDTVAVLKWTKEHDSTRLVDGPSGWEDRGWGDMKDMHNYPGPGMFPVMEDRASVLGEFGGLGLPLEGRLWQSDRNWGYRTYKTHEELAEQYHRLVVNLRPLIGAGLAAAVYTQTTDVEGEVNGLLTYDREVVKIDAKQLAQWHAKLYGPAPVQRVVMATSEREPQAWRYTTAKPAADWSSAAFDDSAWKHGPGGLGTKETPNTQVRTTWDTPDIWVRRAFELSEADAAAVAAGGGELLLSIYHDEDAEVFINGVKAAELKEFVTGYVVTPVSADAARAVRKGPNVIAIHCRQTQGGQYIDAGLIRLEPAKGE